MPTGFSTAQPFGPGLSAYAVAHRDGEALATLAMAESGATAALPGKIARTFSGSIPDSVPSGTVQLIAYIRAGAEPDPDADIEVAYLSLLHLGGGVRLPEAIVSFANADATLSGLLPGGVWFGQADDSALAHPAYAEVTMIPPGETREPLLGRGLRAHIVTTSWGVAIYSVEPGRAEEARDAWYSRFRPPPDGDDPPDVEDGGPISWWCSRGFHQQDNDQVSSEGDPVYVRTVAMMTRYAVEYPRG